MASNSTSVNINDCIIAQAVHRDAEVVFTQVGQLILAIITLILLKCVIVSYRKQKYPLHPNLMLLVRNIVFLYIFHSIQLIVLQGRYQILLYFSSDPCAYLTPVWLDIILRVPSYIYVGAFTLSHFALTTERARATFFATSYEREGAWYPRFCMVAIWALTLLIAGSVVFLALQDPTFSKPLVHVNLLTDTNATYSLYVHFVTLALIFITAIMDYILLVKNRNNRCRTDSLCYSLSRKYQIKENIVVMSLIWPLDMWYAAVFSVYYIGSCYIRLVRANLSVAQFVANYDVLYMLLPMHSIVTLLLYLRFVKKCKSKRANDPIAEPENPAKLYFEQLRSQWGIQK